MTAAACPSFDPASLIDLDRYPVTTGGSLRIEEVLDEARAQLHATGAVELAGFVHGSGVELLVADARSLEARAHHSEGLGTAYLAVPGDDVGPEHPTRWRGRYSLGAVAYDLIPLASPLRQLYEWEPLKDFVCAILGRGPLYRYADPFGALNLAVMGEGDELQWHFDQTDFVVSVAIAGSDSGGEFEVVPLVRSIGDEHYEDVAAVLSGDRRRVVSLPMNPGTLLIFEGRNSLHRVSPVGPGRPRYVGLLGYDTKPGATGSELLHLQRYGRTEAFEEPPHGESVPASVGHRFGSSIAPPSSAL